MSTSSWGRSSEVSKNEVGHYSSDRRLYECIGADGMAIVTDSTIHLGGRTPRKEQITDLVDWLDERTESDYYATSRLAGDYPQADHIRDTASGVFFHSLNKGSRQGVLWFRSEKKRTVLWAGEPDKADQTGDEKRLPRKSFAVWQQLVANTCAEWEEPEIHGGIRLGTNIQNSVFLSHITREEEKYRLQTYELRKLNEELGNFNHICSHDLQEPIRKIQVFSNMLLSGRRLPAGLEEEQVLTKINSSAQRAIALINDLLELASVSNYSAVWGVVNLDDCLAGVKTDLELVMEEKNATLTHELLGNIDGIPTQIEQLMYNLIGNALKFSKGPPQVTITLKDATPSEIMRQTPLDPQRPYVCLKISDNGIGFDPEFAQRIFSVFYRLDDRQAYAGRGIGLAICKKIADNHQGHITAESAKGGGASFYVYLKKGGSR